MTASEASPRDLSMREDASLGVCTFPFVEKTGFEKSCDGVRCHHTCDTVSVEGLLVRGSNGGLLS